MKLSDICQKIDITYPVHLRDFEVKGITSNSKKVKQGFIFVCLEGTKTDGHRYINDALIRGASAVIIEKENFSCDCSILVSDTRGALAKMMNIFCKEPTKKLKFIAVTGTNGKTSVSVMIKNILDKANISCEVIGTLNCSSFSETHDDSTANFTTPDPEELYPMLQRIADAGVEFVIMEASSHALKLKKLEPIEFEIGIFTNLTEDHLDFHRNMEDYFKAKLTLFDKCKRGIINIDDDYGKLILKSSPCNLLSCSLNYNADFTAKNIENLGEHGVKYKIQNNNKEFDLIINIPGEFSVYNSMQAIACALCLEIDEYTIREAFKSFDGVRGRLEKIELFEGRGFAVFIDYAHTPDALKKLLNTANGFKKPNQRVVLLFGCGGDREKEKRKIMGKIAIENADYVIVTSDNPRSENPNLIINEILEGIENANNFAVIPDRKKAIEYAIATAQKNDIVILAGKGHENYEINANGREPFDERDILFALYRKYYERKCMDNEN